MIFHTRYIVYHSFINSSSKNSSVEFCRKKIINISFHKSLERPSEKKCVCLRLETCEENMKKNQIVAKSTFFTYKMKDSDCMKKKSV